jgi:hypothetical protein
VSAEGEDRERDEHGATLGRRSPPVVCNASSVATGASRVVDREAMRRSVSRMIAVVAVTSASDRCNRSAGGPLLSGSGCVGGGDLVAAFGELFDELGAERGKIVRFAAGDEAVVDDDLLVGPGAAGVDDVRPQTRP